MASAAGLVHFGLPDMPRGFSSRQELQHMISTSHNLLPQACHIDASFLAFMDLQLGALVRQQIVDVLIVQLQTARFVRIEIMSAS